MKDLTQHSQYDDADLAYFRGKGYTDEEILAFWNRDAEQGKAPQQHTARIPNFTGTFGR